MLSRNLTITFTIILLTITLSGNSQKPFVRFPTINSDGTTILFTYQGDIWKTNVDGGEAQRITSNPAHDSYPVWCNDDKTIAFSSDRNGNYDIFQIPIDNGITEQITFHSKDDLLYSSFQNNLYFNSDRYFAQVEREYDLMQIALNGGTPQRIFDATGYTPTPSPDGTKIAFVRGSCKLSREDYRGSANKDIWIYDLKTDSYQQITTFEGNDYLPRWKNNNTLWFISARSGRYNIHEATIGAEVIFNAITNFTDSGVRLFTMSNNGLIALEKGMGIYLYQDGKASELKIQIPQDNLFSENKYTNYSKSIEKYELSPKEKQIAFLIRGNLFVKYNNKLAKEAKLIDGSSYRIKEFKWLDEKTILYTCDEHQQYDLFVIQTNGDKSTLFESLKYTRERLTHTDADEKNIAVKDNHIAFVRGDGKLITTRYSEGSLGKETVLLDGWATPSSISWSPDRNYLAYSKSDLKGNREIYIHSADGSNDPVNVSMHPRSDENPVWSHNKLAFLSRRNNSDSDIWFVWLSEKDWRRTKTEWNTLEFLDDSTQVDTAMVHIDFDGIYKRISQVSGLPGNESNLQISKDGKTFYFVANRNDRRSFKAQNNIYSVNWDGSKLKAITSDSKKPYRLKIDQKSKKLYFTHNGGRLSRIDTKTNKQESIDFSAEAWLSYPAEKEQVFEEAWRAIQNGFYDPHHHQKDWKALKNQYKPICMAASTSYDFNYAFNLMLGQINASHMGLRNTPKRYQTEHIKTGLLGLDITPEEKGIRINKVLKNTPADREDNKLLSGDYITKVNHHPVNVEKNFYKPLANTAHKQVILTVIRNEQEKEIIIRPTLSIDLQRYEAWVDDRKAITENISDGRLGYIHIRGMNWNSFEQFERELAATAYEKEGLVIDVRFNGGGWTTDYLMAILDVRQHAYTIPRGATDNLEKDHKKYRDFYPFGQRLPFFPWTKPSVALCNQNSYSNAEIFSHAYQSFDLGTLVGSPTFGAVISTGATRLVDGSYVRLPFRAWYNKKTDKNMEHYPAVPDVIIRNQPDSKAKGEDPQLRKAIEILLDQLDKK